MILYQDEVAHTELACQRLARSREACRRRYAERVSEEADRDSHGTAMGLALTPDGLPSKVVCWYALDDWGAVGTADIAAAAERAAASLSLTVGVATRQPPDHLRPLLAALTVTLVPLSVTYCSAHVVQVDDLDNAAATLQSAVDRTPQACVVLGQVLRQTAQLDCARGLAAEAAAYSMLLTGGEFARWLAGRPEPATPAVPSHSPVQVHRIGGRLSLVLNQPERRNALSVRMREALYEALELAVLDETVDEVQLSGAGPAFCSGGDLDEFGVATDMVAAYLVRLDRAPWRLIDRLRERIAVEVHGAAVGAGAEMAAFAGRVVASPESFFLLPEVEMGLIPGAGGTVSVPRRVGRWRAAWMMLSGNRIDATTALCWGLVDEFVQR